MIQDIFPHVLNNQFEENARVNDKSLIVHAKGLYLLVNQTDRKLFPSYSLLKRESATAVNEDELVYLFRLDEQDYFLLRCEADIEISGYEYISVRYLRERNNISKPNAFAANTAKHLADWYMDNKFCGRCGHSMVDSGKERARTCPKCSYTVYPRIMPAVIVGVINQDKILITKYRTGYKHNALIAGFTEIGETVEQTVAREVMEEAGIRVKNIRYYKSQPWGVANDILLGYYCEVDGDAEIKMDENELSYAEWVERSEIQLQPDDYSLTNEMMAKFKANEI